MGEGVLSLMRHLSKSKAAMENPAETFKTGESRGNRERGDPRRRGWEMGFRQHGGLAIAKRKTVPRSKNGFRRGWPERGVGVGCWDVEGVHVGWPFLCAVSRVISWE